MERAMEVAAGGEATDNPHMTVRSSRGDAASPLNFFIAYASPDRATADRLYELLARESTVFLDHRSLQLGDDWDRELSSAQQRADVTVVLVSDHTEEGFYQREEIAAAIEMARRGSHRVVPIWLTGGEQRRNVPYGLRVKYGVQVSDPGELEDVARQLLLAVRRRDSSSAPATATSPATPAIDEPARADWSSGGRQLLELKHDALGKVQSAAFSPDGRYLATAGGPLDRVARVWELPAGRQILQLEHGPPVKERLVGEDAGIYDVAFSRDGRYLATAGGRDKTARIWEFPGGRDMLQLKHNGWLAAVTQVAFSPDGRYLASVTAVSKTVRVWELPSGRQIRQLQHGLGASVRGVAFSADGHYLATAAEQDGTARVWELPSGHQIRQLQHRESTSVRGVAFSADGHYLATAGGPPTGPDSVRVWELSRSREVLELKHGASSGMWRLAPTGSTWLPRAARRQRCGISRVATKCGNWSTGEA
jgi:hypothetical protein